MLSNMYYYKLIRLNLNNKISTQGLFFLNNNMLLFSTVLNTDYNMAFISKSYMLDFFKELKGVWGNVILSLDKVRLGMFFNNVDNNNIFYYVKLSEFVKNIHKALSKFESRNFKSNLINSYKSYLLKNLYLKRKQINKKEFRDLFNYLNYLYKSYKTRETFIYRSFFKKWILVEKLKSNREKIVDNYDVETHNLTLRNFIDRFLFNIMEVLQTSEENNLKIYFLNMKKTLFSNTSPDDKFLRLRNACVKFTFVYLWFFKDFVLSNKLNNVEYYAVLYNSIRVFAYVNNLRDFILSSWDLDLVRFYNVDLGPKNVYKIFKSIILGGSTGDVLHKNVENDWVVEITMFVKNLVLLEKFFKKAYSKSLSTELHNDEEEFKLRKKPYDPTKDKYLLDVKSLKIDDLGFEDLVDMQGTKSKMTYFLKFVILKNMIHTFLEGLSNNLENLRNVEYRNINVKKFKFLTGLLKVDSISTLVQLYNSLKLHDGRFFYLKLKFLEYNLRTYRLEDKSLDVLLKDLKFLKGFKSDLNLLYLNVQNKSDKIKNYIKKVIIITENLQLEVYKNLKVTESRLNFKLKKTNLRNDKVFGKSKSNLKKKNGQNISKKFNPNIRLLRRGNRSQKLWPVIMGKDETYLDYITFDYNYTQVYRKLVKDPEVYSSLYKERGPVAVTLRRDNVKGGYDFLEVILVFKKTYSNLFLQLLVFDEVEKREKVFFVKSLGQSAGFGNKKFKNKKKKRSNDLFKLLMTDAIYKMVNNGVRRLSIRVLDYKIPNYFINSVLFLLDKNSIEVTGWEFLLKRPHGKALRKKKALRK